MTFQAALVIISMILTLGLIWTVTAISEMIKEVVFMIFHSCGQDVDNQDEK